jgi:hypothetical protein
MIRDLVTGGRIIRLTIVLLLLAIGAVVGNNEIARHLVPATGAYPAELFVPDAERGLAPNPNYAGAAERAGIAFPIRINSVGYRDAEWADDKHLHILLVGSSATFGVGLPREGGIAAKLGEALGREVTVLNAGVYSYGPPQILRTIEKECPAQHPALVLYLHEYKATRRDFLGDRPFSGGGGDAAGSASPPVSLWDPTFRATRAFLSAHDLHPRQVAERVWGLSHLSDDYLLAHYALTRPSPEFPPAAVASAAKLIIAMQKAARDCGAAFGMAVLPGPAEAYYGLREPATQLVLQNLAESPGKVAILDTRDGIPLGSRLILPGLDYLNEAGTGWVAARLVPFVRQLLMPK